MDRRGFLKGLAGCAAAAPLVFKERGEKPPKVLPGQVYIMAGESLSRGHIVGVAAENIEKGEFGQIITHGYCDHILEGGVSL